MASIAIPADLVDAIASEMASGVDRAVECWMSQIEQALTDSAPNLARTAFCRTRGSGAIQTSDRKNTFEASGQLVHLWKVQ